ncbi:TPA: hypothetical protein SC798_000391 [Campylobacter jejuni]|uniref:Uncharacterized protein n=3 Tax=Campylobacter jejuni TaxID=197 RepID=A0A5T1C1E1_CAMJU|nr:MULTISPECIES: DUF6270 domain-containing protein [Campylobacter]EAH5464579.1 hypothetical protein [Campylobacter jejuni]EAH6176076.1 hypothetical protein [Campylobacter jejuni]EAH6515161.1 hypothetical protein [Campylobacter jejuni]EAH8215193.1 hypothetical protein [Campylobacter jejuni]EAH8640644.1 hypothetical protein [Campylobacter jejuni]
MKNIYDLYMIQDKIVLNKVYWSDVFYNGNKFSISQEELISNNNFLKERYDDFVNFFPKIKCIEYFKDILVLDHKHKWGGGLLCIIIQILINMHI